VNYAGLKTCSGEDTVTDFTPPLIDAYPNVTVISRNPVIKVWTDETAVCRLNATIFEYTNTTYHEFKTGLDDGNYGYVITCTDESGNSATESFTLSVDTSIIIDDFSYGNFESFEKIITGFSVDVTEGGNPVSGININEFELSIDGASILISVYDIGDGKYNISYLAPDAGTYPASLTIGQLNNNFTIISKDLNVFGIYYDPMLDPTNTRHISFYNSGTRIGIATDSDVNLIGMEQPGIINVSEVDSEDNIFIFNTRINKNFLGSEKHLEEGFIGKMNPAFGYVLSDTYFISLILNPGYDIKSNSSDKMNGKYSYFMENRISRSGKKEVIMYEE
jgi:hypothetical protein